ncbi:MAG: hypothetical protein Q9221_007968 [Calogaya cf. arnoldii]
MQKAQAALQYAAPAITLLYYLSSVIHAIVTLQTGHKNEQNRLRHIAIWCVRLILVTYLAQCGDLVIDSFLAHPTTTTLAANARFDHKYSRSDEESAASLLKHQLRSAQVENGSTTGNYGSVVITEAAHPESSDTEDSKGDNSDDDDSIKATKKRRQPMNQRLRKDGNWFTYLRGFSLFVPMIWPTTRPLLYLNMFGCVLCILSVRVFNVLQPRQLGILVNALGSGSGSIYQGVALYVFYYWIPRVLGMIREWLWLPVEQHADTQISVRAYNHIMELSMDFHNNKQTGELFTTIGHGRSVSHLLEMVCWRFGPILLDIVVGYGYLYHLFGPYMALLGAATTLAYLSSAIPLNTKLTKYRRKWQALSRKESQIMYDSVGSWTTVSYFNNVPYEEMRYKGAVSLSVNAWRLFSLAYDFIGQITPLESSALMHKQLLHSLVDSEKLLQLLRLEPKIKDGATKFILKGGAIEFRNVHFSYDGAKQIIKAVSFSAQPGQKIALVGVTGGGKSTLLKLLFRFYDVTEGSISIDGQDVRSVTVDSLRSCIGVVPQDISMFNDTVMNNVRYAKFDATDEEVMEACKAAVIHDQILSFTDGYQSTVGEKGVKLSGGELQRLAIARAILKDPAIILLDEATSSVDTDTESRIQTALHGLTKGRTTFTIAHRLSTIVDADIILVVKNGEIVEQGAPKELLAAKKDYYHLWSKQVGIMSKTIDPTDATKEGFHTRSENGQAQSSFSEHKKMFRPDAPEFIPSHLKGSTSSSAPAGKLKTNAEAGSSEQPHHEMDNATNLEAESRDNGQQARSNGDKLVQEDSKDGTAEEAGDQTCGDTKTANKKSADPQKHTNVSRVRRRRMSKSEQGDSSVSNGDGHVDTANTTPEGSGEGSATQYRRVSAPSTSTENGKPSRRTRQNSHRQWKRKRNTSSSKTQSAPGTWSGIPQPVAPATTPDNNGEGLETYSSEHPLQNLLEREVQSCSKLPATAPMHVLVTNDDGPPSNQSSPYIHSFVKTLQSAGHTVSVILPHQQRSWIGKAHFAAQVIKPTYFRPGNLHQDDGTTHAKPLQSEADSDNDNEEWVLVNSTPATAAQLGLFHFFQDRGPVDLVISGPNYGRNTTSLFSLSSGTIGGAMEAAVCRKRAIALSYAFFSRNHDPEIIAGASRTSVKLVEHLAGHWDDGVDLYSVNVPLIEGIEGKKVLYTYALQNYWASGSSFTEIEAKDEGNEDPEEREMEIRMQEGDNEGEDSEEKKRGHKHRHFTWTPKFSDVYQSVEKSEPGNDGWAVKEGLVSVTPLKANFMHVPGLKGELKLSPKSIMQPPKFYASIDYEDTYTHAIILNAFSSLVPPEHYNLIPTINDLPSASSPFFQISSYESIPFQHLHDNPRTALANSYVIRKALIRKHYLAHTVQSYLVKYAASELRNHVPVTVDFEVDYAEFLDEALIEAYELDESFTRNEGKEASDREWWILKPSMSDRGIGIRLFSTGQELHDIFNEWEADQPESDDDDEDEDKADEEVKPVTSNAEASRTQGIDSSIMVSQLRHFVAQPYIRPLLLPEYLNRKYHIRTYVLNVGAIRVYVYEQMLVLFAEVPYRAPGTSINPQSKDDTVAAMDMRAHLTNTCLQPASSSSSPTVLPLHSINSLCLRPPLLSSITTQIYTTTSTLFRAAVAQPTNFQPLPNAFEVFGVDWLVDPEGKVHLLEVNAFPDFKQSGQEEGRGVIEGLWKGVLGIVLLGVGEGRGFFGELGGESRVAAGDVEGKWGMKEVLDMDMGRR